MPSNIARNSVRRKKQTRLKFDPIDPDLRSSSPANTSPANLCYQLPNIRVTPSSSRNMYTVDDVEEGSDVLSSNKKGFVAKASVKRNGKGKDKADGKLPFKTLTTTIEMLQVKGNSPLESIGDEIESNKTASGHRKTMDTKASQKIMGPSSRTSRRRPMLNLDESDGSPPEDEVETPSKRQKCKQKAFELSPDYGVDQDSEDTDGDVPLLSQRNARSTRASTSIKPPMKTHSQSMRGSTTLTSSLDPNGRKTRSSTATKPPSKAKDRIQKSVTLSSNSDDELAFPVNKYSRKRKASKATKKKVPASGDEEFDDPLPGTTSQRTKLKPIIYNVSETEVELPMISKSLTSSQSSGQGKAKKKVIEIEDDSDSDAIVVISPNRRRLVVPIARDDDVDEESDEEPISSQSKKRRQPVAADTDSDIPSSPRKRRKRAAVEEDEDEDSDLPSVKNIPSRCRTRSGSSASATPARITRQLKGRKHRTAKEKQMELLKRKRAGEDIEELTNSTESSEEPQRGIYDSDSDLAMLSNFEDESELDPEVVEKPKQKRKSKVDSYALSEDSDFVVEDDEGPLGVPYHDIPLQFRHAAHKPMKDHFKDAVEWMVHRKINPAFAREDEIYLQAFKKLDDEYQGYAKSKFISTQWTAEFTKAIYARPTFIERRCAEGEGYTPDGVPKCDVCNHRKHFPKFAIHFEGKAYYKSTLDEVEIERDSEDEDPDDDDVQSVNSKGHDLPSQRKEWFSGIVCRDNAQQAHTLIHWKYALNEWVVDQLDSEGYSTPEQLAEREKMKAKERRDYANKVVDGWDASGVVKGLYGDFKRQLEAARESKQGRWERERLMGFGGDD